MAGGGEVHKSFSGVGKGGARNGGEGIVVWSWGNGKGEGGL
jgi:hypothetical protein